MKVFRTDTDKEFYTEEGCFITEIINTSEFSEISLAQTRLAPGTETQLHLLCGTSELYYVTEGIGLVEVGNESATLEKGDCILIRAGESQKIRNIGDGDLIFLCICQPRFEIKNYKEVV